MDAKAYEVLVSGFYDKKAYKKIIELLTDEILNRELNESLFTYRGLSHVNLKQFNEAIFYYNKALEIKSDSSINYCNRGVARLQLGMIDDSIEDFSKGIEANNNDPVIYRNRAFAWEAKGEFTKAIDDASKAIKITSSSTDYISRGVIFNNHGKFDEAIKDYDRAIKNDKESSDAYNNRGITWGLKGKQEKALADLNKALELDNKSVAAYFNRGLMHYLSCNYEEAEKDFKAKIRLTKNHDYFSFVAIASLKEISAFNKDRELKEISTIVRQIKNLLWVKNGNITHYTSLSVAKTLILNNIPFRLSEGTFLNDTSEGRGLFEFLDYNPALKSFSKGNLADKFSQKPFIGSFVSNIKDNDLTLWRMYGKENKDEAKGCSITIDLTRFISKVNNKLVNHDKLTDPSQVSDDINLYRVAYRQLNNSKEFVVPGMQKGERVLNSLMNTLQKKVKLYVAKKTNTANLDELLNSISFIFKSIEYMHENELRLVVNGAGFAKILNKELAPPKVFIEMDVIRTMIKKIIIGPKVERADEWAASFFYSYENESTKPEILISHLPFK